MSGVTGSSGGPPAGPRVPKSALWVGALVVVAILALVVGMKISGNGSTVQNVGNTSVVPSAPASVAPAANTLSPAPAAATEESEPPGQSDANESEAPGKGDKESPGAPESDGPNNGSTAEPEND